MANLDGPEAAADDAVDPDGHPVLWAITWRARSVSWKIRHRALLVGGMPFDQHSP